MPIVAMCPYCRAGGVRAPDRAVGQSATCPKCQSNFTIVPSEETPARPADTYEVARPSRPQTTPVDETRASDPADVTEPSPVLPPEPVPAMAAAPPATSPRFTSSPASTADPAFVMALTASSLFGLGILATLFPFGRVVGVVVAGFGLLLGLLCLLADGRARLVGGTGAGLNALAVALFLFAPTWLGLTPWSDEEVDNGPKVPVAIGHGTSAKDPAEWVEAHRASWQFGDLRVTVRPATIGPVELIGPKGAKRKTGSRYLQIPVTLTNTGADRLIEMTGWATGTTGEGIRLTDSSGKPLTRETFEPGWEPAGQVKPNGLFPGNSAELVLVFDVPSSRSETLKFELSGAALGTEHSIRFRINSPLPTPAPRKRP